MGGYKINFECYLAEIDHIKSMFETIDIDWLDDANCVKEDLDNSVFFPENKAQMKASTLEMCLACPVRMRCMKSVMDKNYIELDSKMNLGSKNHHHGFFGGLNGKERMQLLSEDEDRWEDISEKLLIKNIEKRKKIEYNRKHRIHKKKTT